MDDIVKDTRFAHITNDPRFKTIPRSQQRVKIDKRFQAMFKDKRFKIKYTVDKRGRPISGTSNEDLQRFYALSSSESSSDSEDEDGNYEEEKLVQSKLKLLKHCERTVNKEVAKSHVKLEHCSEVNHRSDDSSTNTRLNEDNSRSNDEKLTDKVKMKLQDLSVDYARGEGEILSGSSSDEESSDNDADLTVEHEWGELDKDADRTEEISSRLAVCNMDWDRIRAVDLMVLFHSFTPSGGLIHSVTVYPSQFGLERMKKEEEEGPQELVENILLPDKGVKSDGSDENLKNDGCSSINMFDENEEGSSYSMEKLRQYQLNRLKYFYAIVECDSSKTANHIYSECDGMEFESSATRLDLRFVPDDTTFEEEPRETCMDMPSAIKYKPRSFTTTALQQGKVDLTWDETDPTRAEIADRLLAGEDVNDDDIKAYLASDDDESDTETRNRSETKEEAAVTKADLAEDETSGNEESGEEENSIEKYRLLLAEIENKQKTLKEGDVQMEISWDLGLKEKAEEAVKKRLSATKDRTPFQEMMEKRKEKRKEKKKQKLQDKVSLSGSGGIDSDRNAFSDDDIPSDVDINDPFFADEMKNRQASKPGKKSLKKSKEGDTINPDSDLKKAELELLLFDGNNSKHFNFNKIQEEEGEKLNVGKRRKAKRRSMIETETPSDDFAIDVNDSRFSSLFSSHHYNIDPTNPHFRKSRAMEALISAKQKKMSQLEDEHVKKRDSKTDEPARKQFKKDLELSALIKAVKRKTKNLKK